MSGEDKVYGNIPEGIIAGVILIALLNHLDLIGFLFAGVVAGLIARGAMRGLLSGLMAGVMVSLLAMIFVMFLPDHGITMINSYLGNNVLTVSITGTLNFLGTLSSNTLIRQLIIDGTVIPAFGAFVGGAIFSPGYSERVDEPEEIL